VLSATGEAINEAAATRDLQALVHAGLLEPVGERRGRPYRGSDRLRAAWQAIRAQRPAAAADDPYVTLVQPSLPGMGG
jgi:hypothetical protein